MIITVTLNPSVDRTVRLPRLTPGSVHVTTLVREDAGGKGVNVSRALGTQGFASHAVVVAGGDRAPWLEASLQAVGAQVARIPIAASMRINLTVVDDAGQVTKLNEPGPVIDQTTLMAVEAEVARLLGDSETAGEDWLVLAGRLPQGLADDAYVRLIDTAHAVGAKVAVDADGPTLAAAVEHRPDLIKPNIHELAELVGRPLATIDDARTAAIEVLGWGVGRVLCSLGSDGALLVTPDQISFAAPEAPVIGTPVGAGDVLLAGFIAHGTDADALVEAIKWSAAAVRLPGTGVPTNEQSAREAVEVFSTIPPDRVIKGD